MALSLDSIFQPFNDFFMKKFATKEAESLLFRFARLPHTFVDDDFLNPQHPDWDPTPFAQQVFSEMFDTGKSPTTIVQEKGLAQISDSGVVERYCDEVIAANPKSAEDFRNGKVAALNFLKGQVMKLSKGKANPALVGEILERKLKG